MLAEYLRHMVRSPSWWGLSIAAVMVQEQPAGPQRCPAALEPLLFHMCSVSEFDVGASAAILDMMWYCLSLWFRGTVGTGDRWRKSSLASRCLARGGQARSDFCSFVYCLSVVSWVSDRV